MTGGLGTFSGGGLGFGLAMSLVDNFTGPSRRINESLDRLDSRVSQVQAHVSKSMNLIGSGTLLTGVGVAMAAGFIPAINRAAELSDKLADIRKTSGLTNEAVIDLRKTIQSFDSRTSLNELLDIAKIGGQIGVAQNQLEGFTKSVDKAVVALGDEFTGGAEQISSELGKIATVFGTAEEFGYEKALLKIGSAINELGAAGIATGPFLTDFTQRLGPIAKQAKMTAADVMGLAAVFEEMGVNPEEAASGFQRLFGVLTTGTAEAAKVAGINLKDLSRGLLDKPNETILNFVKTLREKYPDTLSFNSALKQMGIDGVGLQKTMAILAEKTALVTEKQKLANQAYSEGSSLQKEFEIKNSTLGANLDKLKKSWDNIWVSLGDTSGGPFNKLVIGLTKLLNVIARFIASPIGKFITGVIMSLAVLLTIIGLTRIATGMFRIGLIKLSLTLFGTKGPIIAHAIATGRLGVAFKLAGRQAMVMGAEIWAALAPLLPIIIPIVLVIAALGAAFYIAKKGFDLFSSKTASELKNLTGFQRILAKIGGVIGGVMEIWNSATSEGFSLSGEMHDKLKELGILDLVLTLGTWIVRIKEMFRGIRDTFKAVWEEVVKVWEKIKPTLTKIKDKFFEVLESLGIPIGKLTGKMSDWREAGKILGYVILAILIPVIILLIVQMFTLAIAVLAAVWPILLIIAVIALIIYAIVHWGEIVDWISQKWAEFKDWVAMKWQQMIDWIKAKWQQFMDWLKGIPGRVKEWGQQLVESIWEGVKSKWDSFTEWLEGKWENLKKKLNPSNWFGDGEEGSISASNNIYHHSVGSAQLATANTNTARAIGGWNPSVNANFTGGPTYTNVYLDGEVIQNNVNDRNNLENSRR